jgi:5-methylcytosine-specific restriction enzyme B
MAETQPLMDAFNTFDRAAIAPWLAEGEKERRAILSRFPRDAWQTLPLEQYALGLDGGDTYCSLLEYHSQHLGSMRGGSARKLLVYRQRDKGSWYFERQYATEQQAWEAVRTGFVRMLELASSGDWDALEDRGALQNARSLTVKTLHVYFPDEILPIASRTHLQHFLGMLERPAAKDAAWDVVRLNRALLAACRERLPIDGWRTNEIERFLYSWADPRTQARIVKVAPGERGRLWDECLAGGYVCVGWDDLGDLLQYESREAFQKRFEELHPVKAKEKGREVWTLLELEPGDRIVANKGTSQILGVGEVVEPGYMWRADRDEYRHTVAVKWDTSFAREIPPQKRWAFQTIADVSAATWGSFTRAEKTPPVASVNIAPDPLHGRIAEALERRKQVILYGPPGTGKTYSARRFAVWWLLTRLGRADAMDVLASPERFAEAERQLASVEAPVGNGIVAGELTRITFHPSYGYEDFVEGFRPYDNGTGTLALRLEPGIFRRVCVAALRQPSKSFLVLVDEINRANVAKVFGELITLLEADKRGLAVTLPQSKDPFLIPPNVFLLGTMNTADRSIRLLDAALRRRFAFIELPPEPALLAGGTAGNLPLDQFLTALNRRIAEQAGNEKQIGHSFFLQGEDVVDDVAEFGRRFREEVLPLLQEYCYEDPAALARLLGTKLVDPETGELDLDLLRDDEELAEALANELLAKQVSPV